MDAKVNGKRACFVFDTGAGDSALYSKGAKRLGLSYTNAPEKVELKPGNVPCGTTETCILEFGGCNYKTTFSVVEFPKELNEVEDGVVGWPSLHQNILMIDASHGAVNFPSKIPEEAANWVQVKICTNSDILTMEIPCSGGKSSTLFVDTGFSGGIKLAPTLWRDWKASNAKQPVTLNSFYYLSEGVLVAEEAWAKKFTLGALVLTGVPVTEASMTDVIHGDMTLGLAALKRLDFIVDGKSGLAYFRAKETPPTAYSHNRLGAVFAPLNLQSDVLIGHVAQGSPAWEAGIRNGDMLLSIGKLDVTKWRTDPSVLPFSQFWERPPGSKLELTLKRGSKVFKVNVVLRHILAP